MSCMLCRAGSGPCRSAWYSQAEPPDGAIQCMCGLAGRQADQYVSELSRPGALTAGAPEPDAAARGHGSRLGSMPCLLGLALAARRQQAPAQASDIDAQHAGHGLHPQRVSAAAQCGACFVLLTLN